MSLSANQSRLQHIISDIKQLPPSKLREVEYFIEFTRYHLPEREIVRSGLLVSEKALKPIWDNPDDAAYDQL